jgi:hypothetical protein
MSFPFRPVVAPTGGDELRVNLGRNGAFLFERVFRFWPEPEPFPGVDPVSGPQVAPSGQELKSAPFDGGAFPFSAPKDPEIQNWQWDATPHHRFRSLFRPLRAR